MGWKDRIIDEGVNAVLLSPDFSISGWYLDG